MESLPSWLKKSSMRRWNCQVDFFRCQKNSAQVVSAVQTSLINNNYLLLNNK